MAFFHQCLPLLMLQAKERPMCSSTVFTYVLNVRIVIIFLFIYISFSCIMRQRLIYWPVFQDGTWSTIKGSFTVVKDFKDVCVHSYYSFMEELRQKDGQYYEIRLAVKFSLPILSHVAVMAKSIIYALIQKSFITKEHYRYQTLSQPICRFQNLASSLLTYKFKSIDHSIPD